MLICLFIVAFFVCFELLLVILYCSKLQDTYEDLMLETNRMYNRLRLFDFRTTDLENSIDK